MNWLEEWFDKAKKVLLSPTDFYEDIEPQGNYSYPVKFAVTSGIVVGLLSVIVNSLRGVVQAKLWLVFSSAVLGGIIGGSIGLLLGAGLIHLFVYLLGGRDYQKTTEAISYATAVNAFLGWIPFVNIIAWVYTVYVQIRGIQKFHDFSTGRAAAAVLLPLVIIVVIAVALAGLFYFFYFPQLGQTAQPFGTGIR